MGRAEGLEEDEEEEEEEEVAPPVEMERADTAASSASTRVSVASLRRTEVGGVGGVTEFLQGAVDGDQEERSERMWAPAEAEAPLMGRSERSRAWIPSPPSPATTSPMLCMGRVRLLGVLRVSSTPSSMAFEEVVEEEVEEVEEVEEEETPP